ncbi:MAG: YdcF family protein [Deltaproteobacteria bacterium]|nr:YdcF family protein [Deltaproteobacteria bacterium]
MSSIKHKALYFGIALLFIALFLYLSSSMIMTRLGGFLVLDEEPVPSDAVVVLCSGVEYYPRLIEAAELFRKGFARKVVINGNRKTDVLRSLEEKGFERCCPWYEESLRILSMFGVPKDQVICISAEDAYDTVSEAEIVGREILQKEFTKIIITTSKFHTRRARFIWNKRFGDTLSICSVSAKTDPYNPKGWWKEGRQIRWVLAEYGAWIYYWWKTY